MPMAEELEQKIKKQLMEVLMKEMDDFSFSEMGEMEGEEAEPMAVIETSEAMPLEDAKEEVGEIMEEAGEESMPMSMDDEDEDDEYKNPSGFKQFMRSKKKGY
jgi:hypothetical protein